MHTESSETNQRRSQVLSSRLPGFYELPIGMRVTIAKQFAGLTGEDAAQLSNCGTLSPELVDVFIENGIGAFSLPLGVATNFLVNGKDILIPMAVEETSVLAAASHGAKLVRAGGGFQCTSSEPIMTGQVQVYLRQPCDYNRILREHKNDLIKFANRGQERLLSRGGGAKDLDWHFIPELDAVVIHVYVDTRDAMGANIVNTMCERVATVVAEILDCEIGLRILSNLADRRLATARCLIPSKTFASDRFSGEEVVDRIVKAYLFAYYDPYRAATHNKGIMNGIDPVLIATGNDWRAIEAGAHAYTCRSGVYRPMTIWNKTREGDLEGTLELPMAVGTVGGVTKLHPTAQAALRLMGSPDARSLAEIVCSVGLAQNLSALRALASEGIQRGHMSLHQKNLELLHRQGTTC